MKITGKQLRTLGFLAILLAAMVYFKVLPVPLSIWGVNSPSGAGAAIFISDYVRMGEAIPFNVSVGQFYDSDVVYSVRDTKTGALLKTGYVAIGQTIQGTFGIMPDSVYNVDVTLTRTPSYTVVASVQGVSIFRAADLTNPTANQTTAPTLVTATDTSGFTTTGGVVYVAPTSPQTGVGIYCPAGTTLSGNSCVLNTVAATSGTTQQQTQPQVQRDNAMFGALIFIGVIAILAIVVKKW